MTKPTAKSRKDAARDARIAEMRAFGETMWKPEAAPAPSFLSGFGMDAETAARWELAKAAR